MRDEFAVGFLIALTVLMVIVIAIMAMFWRNFTDKVHYICRNMDCADSYNEYRYWRRELRCHYLTLIPFVGERNVKHVYHFFYKGRRAEKEEMRKDGLKPILLPSVLGICVCVICVCGMTWAWFSTSISGGTNTIKAAHYEISVEVRNGSNELVSVDDDGDYKLAPGNYTVDLTAQGDASTGYCRIQVGNTEPGQHTEQIYTESSASVSEGRKSSIAFKVEISGTEAAVSFIPVWGTYSGENVIRENKIVKIENGNIVEDQADNNQEIQDGNTQEVQDGNTEQPSSQN